MKPKDGFDAAIVRVNHLLLLYDLLHNTRTRRIRRDWASKFTALMGWPKSEAIVRVDGAGKNSLLILRANVGIDHTSFSHDFLTELLRSAVVASVAALDRYLHDLVLHHSWTLLTRADGKIPTELRKLKLPVLATKQALQKLRKDPKARPGHLVKAALQEHLHREYTFQRPDDLENAARMLGVKDFWGEVSAKMPGVPAKSEIIEKIRTIAQRRNQIVHEADMIRKTKAKKITLRDITRATAADWCAWMPQFVQAVDEVVAATV